MELAHLAVACQPAFRKDADLLAVLELLGDARIGALEEPLVRLHAEERREAAIRPLRGSG